MLLQLNLILLLSKELSFSATIQTFFVHEKLMLHMASGQTLNLRRENMRITTSGLMKMAHPCVRMCFPRLLKEETH